MWFPNRFDEAADTIRREIIINTELELTRQLGRLTVCLILVQLAREDQVAAEKAYREFGNYCEVSEAQTLEMLLQVSWLHTSSLLSGHSRRRFVIWHGIFVAQAIDNEDAVEARRYLNSPFIRHMDVEYAVLARDLKLPESHMDVPKARIVENAEQPYQSPPPEEVRTALVYLWYSRSTERWIYCASITLRFGVSRRRRLHRANGQPNPCQAHPTHWHAPRARKNQR